MKSKRIQWLDFAKGLTILAVVICHSGFEHNTLFDLLEYVLLTCVMPIFFSISGFLYKPTINWSKYELLIYKKVTSFVLPFIIFTFLGVILHMTTNHNIIYNLYHIYYLPIGYLWFLYVLFFIFLIVGLMNVLRIKLYIQVIISICFLFAQMFLPWHESYKGNINPLAAIGGYLICFYMGYALKKFNLFNYLKYSYIYIPINICWILILIAQIYMTGLKYNTDMLLPYNFITKILSIPMFFSLFIKFSHNKFFKYFDKYGKYTLIIYLTHGVVIQIMRHFVAVFNITNSLIVFFVLFISGWYLSILTCKLSNQFKLVNFVFYPRKYINKVVLRTKWGKKLLYK